MQNNVTTENAAATPALAVLEPPSSGALEAVIDVAVTAAILGAEAKPLPEIVRMVAPINKAPGIRGVISANTKCGQKLRIIFREGAESTHVVAFRMEGMLSLARFAIEELEVTAELVQYLGSPTSCLEPDSGWNPDCLIDHKPVVETPTQDRLVPELSATALTPSPEGARPIIAPEAPAVVPTVEATLVEVPAVAEAPTVQLEVVPTPPAAEPTPVATVPEYRTGSMKDALKFANTNMDTNGHGVVICPTIEVYEDFCDLLDSCGVPFTDGRPKPGYIALVIVSSKVEPLKPADDVLLLAA